jgi:hypothetical protein
MLIGSSIGELTLATWDDLPDGSALKAWPTLVPGDPAGSTLKAPWSQRRRVRAVSMGGGMCGVQHLLAEPYAPR